MEFQGVAFRSATPLLAAPRIEFLDPTRLLRQDHGFGAGGVASFGKREARARVTFAATAFAKPNKNWYPFPLCASGIGMAPTAALIT